MLGEDTGACPRSFTGKRSELRTVSGVLLALSCAAPEPVEAGPHPLRIATSYSLEQSGLFEALATGFARETNQSTHPFFVGSGEALAMGRAGTADIVLANARHMEDAFVSEGFGINRREVMYSEYVIVGPPSDPVGIGGLHSAVEALTRLSRSGATFVSRGDDSGNHTRERELWSLTGVALDGAWYRSLGAGMFETLSEASLLGAYAIADRPTYLANQSRLDLKVLVEGDTRLHNPYGVIAVNPTRVKDANYAGAISFIDFLTSPRGQIIIAEFGQREHGAALFAPSGRTKDKD